VCSTLKNNNNKVTKAIIYILKKHINPGKCDVKNYDLKSQPIQKDKQISLTNTDKDVFVVYNTDNVELPDITVPNDYDGTIYIAYHKKYKINQLKIKHTAIFYNYTDTEHIQLNKNIETVFSFSNTKTDIVSTINFNKTHKVRELYLHNLTITTKIFEVFPLLNCLYLYDYNIESTTDNKNYYINYIMSNTTTLNNKIITIHDTTQDKNNAYLLPYEKIYNKITEIYDPK